MTYVVTESCVKCKYTDCVEVCPVDCFKEGPNFLVIDPDECIDCGVCIPECPVDAIVADRDMTEEQKPWLPINIELSKIWPVITRSRAPLDTAEEFKDEIDINNIILIGHSRGGAIAILKASEDARIKKLITWAAVCDLNRSMFEQGASKVKSAYSSVLNAQLSNKNNIPLRDQYIKDAQEKFRFSSISHKNVELELNNSILKIYLKYGLSEKDFIDTSTGKITKPVS